MTLVVIPSHSFLNQTTNIIAIITIDLGNYTNPMAYGTLIKSTQLLVLVPISLR